VKILGKGARGKRRPTDCEIVLRREAQR
jgi:hypothetical protein